MTATATVLAFPPFVIRIVRDDGAWLVVCRSHGWVCGSRAEASAEAGWLSRNFGVPVVDRSVGGRP